MAEDKALRQALITLDSATVARDRATLAAKIARDLNMETLASELDELAHGYTVLQDGLVKLIEAIRLGSTPVPKPAE